MNLPLVFDIALGLIFIFLTLSLLASEIQELITTLLQWRAVHLKKSIEILLTGEAEEHSKYQEFIDTFYRSSLLQGLNQEAKGIFPALFRQITRSIGAFYRAITGTRNPFGNSNSGPSYIPAESFASALLQRLDLKALSQRVSEYTLRRFGEEKLTLLQDVLVALRSSLGDDTLLETEVANLRQRLHDITQDFVNNRTTLVKGVDQIVEQISQFINSTEEMLKTNNHCKEIIVQRLPYLKHAVQVKKLEPTISEVLSMVLENRDDLPTELSEVVDQIRANLVDLPPHLRQSLLALSEEAQLKSQGLKEGVRQLELEVETWFNRSMERASGVYKRNSKGVAILLGVLIAIATNTDTFLVVDRLSRDTAVRTSIAQTADQLIAQQISTSERVVLNTPETELATEFPPNPELALPETGAPLAPSPSRENPALEQDLEEVKNAVSKVLQEIPLPLGWNQENLSLQLPAGGNMAIAIPKLLLGWLITGIAISMGSSFWFDLLGKVIRVRNTGSSSKPSPSD